MSPGNSFESEGVFISTTQKLECTFTWTIRQFKAKLQCLAEWRAIDSSTFAADLDGKVECVISIRRCPYYTDRELLFVLKPKGSLRTLSLSGHYEFLFKCQAEQKHLEFRGQKDFPVGQTTIGYLPLKSFDDCLKQEHNADVVVSCKLFVSTECRRWSNRFTPPNRNPKIELDLVKLLDSGEFSDITVEASGLRIRAHKNILAARSEYFRAMLTHNTIEANSGHVKINDIKAQIMRAVLRFIYSGKINFESTEGEGEFEEELPCRGENNQISDGNSDNVTDTKTQEFYQKNSFVIDLLKAADKCQLDDLKLDCELALCDRISPETAPDLLKLAHIYQAPNLKNRVIQFTIVYAKEMISVESFRHVLKDHLELSQELLEAHMNALTSGLELRTTRVNLEFDGYYDNRRA